MDPLAPFTCVVKDIDVICEDIYDGTSIQVSLMYERDITIDITSICEEDIALELSPLKEAIIIVYIPMKVMEDVEVDVAIEEWHSCKEVVHTEHVSL